MPITVRFDPTSTSKQAQVIPDATPTSDGVMTKEQARKLADLVINTTDFFATTTDGTPEIIGKIVATGDGSYQCGVRGVASDTGSANAACFNNLEFAFIVSGGVVVATSVPSQLTGNPNTGVGAAYTIDLVPNGADIDIRVTGFAGTTLSWKVQVELLFIMGPGTALFATP